MLIELLLIYQHIRRMMMVEKTVLGVWTSKRATYFYGTISNGKKCVTKAEPRVVWETRRISRRGLSGWINVLTAWTWPIECERRKLLQFPITELISHDVIARGLCNPVEINFGN